MTKNPLQFLGTPNKWNTYLLQVFLPLEVTSVQAGVIPLLTHSAFDFHMKHVLQPSDYLEKAVSSFSEQAGERDARALARNQVLQLGTVCHPHRALLCSSAVGDSFSSPEGDRGCCVLDMPWEGQLEEGLENHQEPAALTCTMAFFI